MKDFFQLNRNLKLRILMTFIGIMTYSTIGSSMTIYYNQYLGAGITGILLIISSVISFLVGIWAGHFTDLEGRRPTMSIGTLASTFGAALAAFSNSPLLFNPWLTFVGLVLSGFGFGFFNAGASAMMVDITTPADRKIVFSLNYWILNVGMAVGSAISGWLFRENLFFLLILVVCGDLLNMLIVAFLIEETFDPKKHVEHQETNIFKAYLQVSKDKIFMFYLLATLFVTMLFLQLDFFIPVHLSDSFKTSSIFGMQIYGQRMLTIIAILNTVMVVMFLSTVRKATSNWSNKRGFAVGASLMGLGFAIICFSQTLPFGLLGALINACGELIFVPFEQSLRADMMDPEQVGVYTGAFTAIQPMAQIICGLLVSLSAFYGGFGMGVILIVVTLLAMIPGMISIGKHEKKLSALTK